MCTYSTWDCYISLQNLNGFWETFVGGPYYFAPFPDTSRCFRIRLYGDFSEDVKRSCSWIESGCNNTVLGYVSDTCLNGVEGESLITEDQVYSNVFTQVKLWESKETGIDINYRLQWNLSHGIIRFEDLTVDPIRRWELYGRIE